MLLSDKIRIIRKARGLSQEGLGFSLSRVSKDGVSRQAVSDWETGKSEPCLDNIRDLAEVLGVSFDALLDEDIDLNDPQVLNLVLTGRKVQKQEEQGIEASISYTIEKNAVSVKMFKRTIASVALLFSTIVFLIPYLLAGDRFIGCFICAFVLAAIAIPTIVRAIVGEIILAFKGKMSYLAGHLNYCELSVEDEFVQMEGYERISNTLHVPIETILEMKLCDNQKGRHGNIEVIIKDREYPLILLDIMYPQKLIDVFKKIKIVLESKKSN